MTLQTDELTNSVPAANAELNIIPDYDYSREDFLTPEPYEELYKLHSTPFLYEVAKAKMKANADAVKFRSFNSMLTKFLKAEMDAKRRNMIPNITNFSEQQVELNCGTWESNDFGIFRDTPNGGKECACAHPIMPIRRLVNIDTGEVKLELAFRRDNRWRRTIVDKATVSTSRGITSLASQGISVTSTTASALVDYLNDLENLNYEIIPEQKAIGRLGYIEGEGFSPFVDGLVFDGDEAYKSLYGYIHEKGSQVEWFNLALECRKMSVTARILLAASFASPLLSVTGSLPFFVHCWGGSGTGKTVALMLAASVWGDPAKGRYVQTFNATRVGQELTAAFLNHLPMCIDELQLTKNGKGQSNFDVYQLAEGVGRARGKKSGGVEKTPTWDCCFLTTGEDPVIGAASGGGAVNRVIEIECFDDQLVINDAPRVAGILKQNFGWAGRMFVERLYKDDKTLNMVREVFQEYVADLSQNDTTEKQAIAAAAILTADLCATAWIFKDDQCLTADDMKSFLASKEAVSAGARAYDWICNWIAENENHFYTEDGTPQTSVYGKIEGNMAYINNNVLSAALNDNGFNVTATYSFLKTRNLIEAGSSKSGNRGYGKQKKIGKTNTYCIYFRLSTDDDCDDDLLPL